MRACLPLYLSVCLPACPSNCLSFGRLYQDPHHAQVLSMLMNQGLVQVSQSTSLPGDLLLSDTDAGVEVWARQLQDQTVAFAVLNRGPALANTSASVDDKHPHLRQHSHQHSRRARARRVTIPFSLVRAKFRWLGVCVGFHLPLAFLTVCLN
jgi:hypothetical protein